MYVFGVNLPLVELFVILIFIIIICIVLILYFLIRIQKMTEDERRELEALEKLAMQEKQDIEQIKQFETRESTDIAKFEKDIMTFEQDTDTLYLKKLAPDLYKVQNYVLWALQRKMQPKDIKANLMKKGWKDNKLIEMVIDDVLRYKGYYIEKKGNVNVPVVRTTAPPPPPKIIERVIQQRQQPPREQIKVVKVIEKPVIIHKTAVVNTSNKKAKKRKAKKTTKSKVNPKTKELFSDVEKELAKLEKDLTKEKKVKKPGKIPVKKLVTKKSPVKKKLSKKVVSNKKVAKKKVAKKLKKPAVKKRSKKVSSKKKSSKDVVLHADKDVNVQIKYKKS